MNDKEINPDVLGYIFEKFINQKEMGAYYTKEDITEYISKNTVIPFLFDQAKEQCLIAFEGVRTVWDLLKENPDRYFYDAVKKGVALNGTDRTEDIKNATVGQIQESVSIGLDTTEPNLLDRRKDWNKKTPEELALPTEIWRETIARWQRYFEVRQKVENGEIQSINDLITNNLNIRQFAQDVIETWEGPELIRAFYKAITKITVLDPTVGSGAFLFAALNILEPLYEACLNRMAEFVEDLPEDAPKSKFSDFKVILLSIDKHPSRSYFIYKTIIINNLYGVDIMDEAVEICKLRLFLKLVAQIDTVKQIEPLPDIDFNIRAGNTLVGFATKEEVEKAVTKTFDFDNNLGKITEKAEDVQALYDVFLEAQMEEDDSAADFKHDLRNKLDELNYTLNHYLAGEYGINVKNKTKYANWLKTHQPFHWFVEFYGILANGGFDVIIGNPPYVEYSKVKKEYKILNYETEECGNLYAFCIERSIELLMDNGMINMIIPLSGLVTPRMSQLKTLLFKYVTYISNFSASAHPSTLFTGVKQRLSIVTTKKDLKAKVHNTNFIRWSEIERDSLFSNKIFYLENKKKINTPVEKNILTKIYLNRNTINEYLYHNTNEKLYYHNAPVYWNKAFNFIPYFYSDRDGIKQSIQVKTLFTRNKNNVKLISILNSTLYYWYFYINSDCWHLTNKEVLNYPVELEKLNTEYFESLSEKLMFDYKSYSIRYKRVSKDTGKNEFDSFYPAKSKSIIDEIDKVLAEHYGFTQEELDFIINYDIKYRMGKELNN
jgi:hypothetical protein